MKKIRCLAWSYALAGQCDLEFGHAGMHDSAGDGFWQNMKFTSLGKYTIASRGALFEVACPIACDNFDWVINKEVEIDGATYTVIGVERFAIVRHSVGERIGLLVRA